MSEYNVIQRWFVRRAERKNEPPTFRPHEHHYGCLGGGGGWEVWGCERCGRADIPSPLGFMWPNLRILQWINPTLRCKPENS